MHKADEASEGNEIHTGPFFYMKNKCKCADRSHLAGIKSFLIAVKEQGHIKEAGE